MINSLDVRLCKHVRLYFKSVMFSTFLFRCNTSTEVADKVAEVFNNCMSKWCISCKIL